MPVYVPIGSFDAKNLAITAFSTRRSEAKPEERQAFVQVANFTDERAERSIVELQLDGEFLDAKEVEVPAGESSGVVFPLADAPAGKLTARLKYELDTPTKRDALEQDDVGYAALNDAKPGRVLVVTPGNVALRSRAGDGAGRQAGEHRDSKRRTCSRADQYKKDAEAGAYDLIIYDQCAPAAMPRANTLFIGRLPPGPTWRGGSKAASRRAEAMTAKAASAATPTDRQKSSTCRRSSIGTGRIRCWRASSWATSMSPTAWCSIRRRVRRC